VRRYSMLEIADGTAVLSGLPRGVVILGKLTSIIQHSETPTIVFLDFAGIDVATSSFIRSAIMGFRDQCVTLKTNNFPVLANISQDTIDELKLAIGSQNDGVFVCELDADDKPSSWQIIGSLDEKQVRTLKAVKTEGEVDATLLQAKHQEIESIGTTAWNNRLTALARKALLVETKRGRVKRYRSITEFA